MGENFELVKNLDTGEMMALDLNTGIMQPCQQDEVETTGAPTVVTTSSEAKLPPAGRGEDSASKKIQDYRHLYETIHSGHSTMKGALKESRVHYSSLLEKVRCLTAALKQEEKSIRAYLCARSEVLRRMKDLADDSPLSPVLDSLTATEEGERERLETVCDVFGESISSDDWSSTLEPKMTALYKCLDTASSDYNHYRDRFDSLLAKEEDDLLHSSKTSKRDGVQQPLLPAKLERNRLKMFAAHTNFVRSVESIVGCVRTSCEDNWIEVVPLLLAYLNFEIALSKKHKDGDQDALQRVADISMSHPQLSLAERIRAATVPVSEAVHRKSPPNTPRRKKATIRDRHPSLRRTRSGTPKGHPPLSSQSTSASDLTDEAIEDEDHIFPPALTRQVTSNTDDTDTKEETNTPQKIRPVAAVLPLA